MKKEIEKLRKHYIICSGEDVGLYVTRELHTTKRNYVVVDSDKTRMGKVLNVFPDLLFVEGDATDNETLLSAGIKEAAGLFAVSGDDNQNLVVSLTAKQLHPGVKVVAKCDDLRNLEKMKKAGADAVVSPSFIGGLRIASEMIRPATVSFLDVMLRDREKNLRIEEVVVPPSFEGKPLGALNLRAFPSLLLLAIKTNGDWLYNPPRNHVLTGGNTLIVMITTDDRLRIERLFEPAASL